MQNFSGVGGGPGGLLERRRTNCDLLGPKNLGGMAYSFGREIVESNKVRGQTVKLHVQESSRRKSGADRWLSTENLSRTPEGPGGGRASLKKMKGGANGDLNEAVSNETPQEPEQG